MKQLIATSRFSDTILSMRGTRDLVLAAFSNISDLETLSNDYLALRLITKIPSAESTFIDIGAHIGSVTSAVRNNVPSAKIIAVEAMPDKARHLRNVFPGVQVIECALGDTDGQVPFFVHTQRSGFSSLNRPAESDKNSYIEIQVQLSRLDCLVSVDDVDSIKIDVEGAELQVICGAGTLIGKNRPLIMFESGSEAHTLLESRKGPLWDKFSSIDYSVFAPNRLAHEGPALTREGFLEAHYYPTRSTNYFAIPNERRIEYRDRARKILSVIPDRD